MATVSYENLALERGEGKFVVSDLRPREIFNIENSVLSMKRSVLSGETRVNAASFSLSLSLFFLSFHRETFFFERGFELFP